MTVMRDNDGLSRGQVDALQKALTGSIPVGHRSAQDLETRAHLMRAAVDREPRTVSLASRAPRAVISAAVLGVVAVMALVWGSRTVSSRPEHTYVTAAGQRLQLTLVDGTRVVLGPESRLSLMPGYAHDTRDLALDGEAYFTVVHDLAHPFTVHTQGIGTRDIGTSFDVRAYRDDKSVRVAVSEGAVALMRTGRNSLLEPLGGTLHAGDVAELVGNHLEISHQVDVAELTEWMQGRLVFNNTVLSDVVRELERTFDLHITVADSAVAAQRITASFDKETVDQILDDIAGLAGGRYERTGKTVVLRKRLPAVRRPASEQRPPLVTAQEHESPE